MIDVSLYHWFIFFKGKKYDKIDSGNLCPIRIRKKLEEIEEMD